MSIEQAIRPEQAAGQQLDPITVEVGWSRLINAVDEASTALVRTSFSSAIRDFHDYACGIFDEKQRLLAQATHSTPGLLGVLPATVRNICEIVPPETLEPGDALITNDPWVATGHVIDVTICSPVFYKGRLVAFATCGVHHLDMGGRMATTESRDIYEEGLKLPVMKLARGGVLNEDVFNLFRLNVRAADKVIGDVRAQIAANHVLTRRVQDLLEERGWDDFSALSENLIGRTEKSFREAIAAAPDGRWVVEQYIDRVAGLEEPVLVRAALEISGSEVTVDFEGTSPQVARAINSTINMTRSYTLYAIKCAFHPDLPNNDGCTRPLKVMAPEGSVLNARWPAATWGRTIIIHYLPEILFRALAQAAPTRVIAGSGSCPIWYCNWNGERQDGRRFLGVTAHQGGLGASLGHDGSSCLSYPGNIATIPIEITESDMPILYQHKEFAVDSGGAGQSRGGIGQHVVLEVTRGEAGPRGQVLVGVRGGRHEYTIPGLRGGCSPAQAATLLNGQAIIPGSQIAMKAGDQLEFQISGGAGFGDPYTRDVRAVARDVQLGFVSPAQAEGVYGVVIDPASGEVSAEQTTQLRGTAARRGSEPTPS